MKYVICCQAKQAPNSIEFYTKNTLWDWDWDVDKAVKFDTQKEALHFMWDNLELFLADNNDNIYYVEAIK